MPESNELWKAVSDFIKGKAGPPDADMAKLSWDGAEPLAPPSLELPSKSFGELGKEYATVTAGLARSTRLETIALIGGLLTLPDLQANSLRLEALAHLAVLHANGKRRPSNANLAAWFNQLDRGTFGRLEDPSEDLFVTTVSNDVGNYRLFQGTAEGNAFHTQVFLEILQTMPRHGRYNVIQRSIYALLTLSDAIASRAAAPRHIVGNVSPLSRIHKPDSADFRILKQRAIFSFSELSELGITPQDVAPFLIDEKNCAYISDSWYGHSPLEMMPLIMSKDSLVVALPNAIGLAIRHLVIQSCLENEQQFALEASLAHAHSILLKNERLFGHLSPPPLKWQAADNFQVAQSSMEIDPAAIFT